MNASTLSDALDEIADPSLANIVSEAVWFCWEQGRAQYSPTAERRRLMQSYIAGRIPTVRLLDKAWAACQVEEKQGMRASLLQQLNDESQRANGPDLDSLDDGEVEHLYRATLKQVARNSR